MKLPRLYRKGVRYPEDAGYVNPSSLAAIIIFLAIIVDVLLGDQPAPEKRWITLTIGIGGVFYVFLQSMVIAPRLQKYRKPYIWINSIVSGIGLSLLALALNDSHHTYYSILLILTVTSIFL